MKPAASNNRRDEAISAPKERSKKIHLEKIISLIPVPYYLGWPLFATAFLLISYLILMQFEGSPEHIDVFIIISAIIALEGTAINWSLIKLDSFEEILFKIIDLPKPAIIKLHKDQEDEIFDDKGMIISAIVLIAFIHASCIDYHAISFNSSASYIILNIGYYFAVYIMGVGLYAMVMTARTIHKIGALPLQVNALYSDFHAVGELYSKFTILAASVYIMWGFFHMIVPPQFSSLQIILWFLLFAVLLLAYFILPQYSIHLMMASTKKEKMERFSSQLRAALDESVNSPTDESALHLKDMLSIQNRLDQMCTWPFGIYELLYVALIILIPLIIVLLEVILGFIK
jgi:hypothetical protein